MKIFLTFLIFRYLYCTLSLINKDDEPEAYRKYAEELNNARIVGGKDCRTKEFPFMASIQFPKHQLTHRCGGTLINSFHVLTAAHCFSHLLSLKEYYVVVGISDMDYIDMVLPNIYAWKEAKRQSDFYGQKSGINSILIYYNYQPLTHVNDIALLHLKNPIVPTAGVGFVNLPPYKYTNHPSTMFKGCTVLGWGIQIPMISVEKPGFNFSSIVFNFSAMLQRVRLPIITNEMCNYFIKQFAHVKVISSQVCTLYAPGGKDACYGDSGGPLICGEIQLGITSTGWGCALPYRPAVYTRTDFFLDWIRENSIVESRSIQTVSSNTVLPYIAKFFKMPPKAAKKQAVIIDGVDTTPMTREQLEVFALRIKEENDREREERNFFQLERDKIRTFWEITRTELEEARAKLRNKDRQIEEEREKSNDELKFYKQKVKHLQYEHQNDLTECTAEAMVSLKKAQDDHTEQERELLRDKRNLKRQAREQETSHQEQVKSTALQYSEEIYKARQEFQDSAKETELKYEKKFSQLKQELETKHKMEMSEVEERKNTQIAELTRNHERWFNDMKNYYNDITLNNLALISSLKDQMEVLRKQNERMAKQVVDLTAENRKLIEPLKQAQADVTEFKRQLVNYEKDKQSLANTKIRLNETKKELDDLRWTNEALELRFEQLQAERDELQKKFVKAVLEVQQKTSLKNELLYRRIQTLKDAVELREVEIGEMKSATDPSHKKINKKLEEILHNKNTMIKDLQYELARICKAHDDMLETYEEKLGQFGIPKHELGFTPLRVVPQGQGGLARGPAGLVTKNR
ncbi:hypothetical protein ILUMI_23060 [Ignelater luminosus]|uniref:Dynein regulatory complex subunit 4 n=1 Tax=Ignelater luminosus TaxID=2038154 RepID=A0A8K0C9H4_IGNLU|nr:hypothetical protein ILUMI_23060 [Ignelater luminosus]